MAPAAAESILTFLKDTGTRPEDYDKIVTGDLGCLGRSLLLSLLRDEGVTVENHEDCGVLLYDLEAQDAHAGASGCGCSAAMLSAHYMPLLWSGALRRILFLSTGAIMSPTSISQGENIFGIAPAIVSSMENGTLSSGDVEATYLSLKADLNAIFGISASNQYRRDTVLSHDGVEYVGEFGICNAPKNPKVWYQFGQRIVGWSRIAQICALELVKPYAKRVINGDTDSIKIVCRKDDLTKISSNLEKLANAIDKGKDIVCSRVKRAYPKYYDELKYIGHYVHEFSADRFCASWNKA